MKKLIILLILLMLAVPAYSKTVYKWVDEKGVINFTNDYKKIPPAVRNQAETKEYFDEKPPPILPQKMTVNVGEEVKTDNDGRDYWRKQLDEATANYEKVRKELLQEGERLVLYRFGSKTQYEMFTEELPSITARFEAYKKQMLEARNMLDEFTKKNQGTENTHGKRAISSKTDIYGRDETWWEEKVRPWKERLKEATENYEETFDAYVEQLERLGPFSRGGLSLTQYQMISSRLTMLSSQIGQDQNQISEAKSMLAKLSKEAKEAGADPVWVE